MNHLRFVVLALILCILVSSSSAWRRRRRRRRSYDTCTNQKHSCTWKWGSCSRSCGGGSQNPVITKAKGSCGKCDLPKARSCNTQSCPIHCKWGAWGNHGPCSVSCGRGLQSRKRSILVHNKYGGKSCIGADVQTTTCNSQCCPKDCTWGAWSKYHPCSATCGSGKQSRSRKITTMQTCGGQCHGSAIDTVSCNKQSCPVDCKWKFWGPYGPCSATCGGGTKSRQREIHSKSYYGGKSCEGSRTQTIACNTKCCPVNCKWGPWTTKKACSVTCGGGTKTRVRQQIKSQACGGEPCKGRSRKIIPCNKNKCPKKYY